MLDMSSSSVAVFTLAARVQQLVPLHAACVGLKGRGVLIMGASGAGNRPSLYFAYWAALIFCLRTAYS